MTPEPSREYKCWIGDFFVKYGDGWAICATPRGAATFQRHFEGLHYLGEPPIDGWCGATLPADVRRTIESLVTRAGAA